MGGLGMKVARICDGIIIIAGPEPLPLISPLGVMALFFWKFMVVWFGWCKRSCQLDGRYDVVKFTTWVRR